MELDTARRVSGVAVTGIICYLAVASGLTRFSLHPILMSIGFILLLAEGAHAFRSGHLYKKHLTIHWVLQLTGVAFIGLGFISIYSHKNEQQFEHFTSDHANTGLTTLLVLVGTTIGGSVARYSPLFWKTLPQLSLFKPIHSLFGVVALFMGMYSVLLALDTQWFRSQTNTFSYLAIYYLTSFNALVTFYKPVLSVWHKIKVAIRR